MDSGPHKQGTPHAKDICDSTQHFQGLVKNVTSKDLVDEVGHLTLESRHGSLRRFADRNLGTYLDVPGQEVIGSKW